MVAALCASPQLVYRSRLWSTGVEPTVSAPGSLVAAVEILWRECRHVDALANRFRPDSELSRLNASSGRPVSVSPGLMELLSVAGAVARATGGAVDPTVGAALCRLGYDRDIAELAGGVDGELPPAASVPGWASIEVDPLAGTVRLPPGTALDLGATAKALVADRVASATARLEGCGVTVSLGGDVAVAGPPPEAGFPVAVGEALDERAAACTVAIFSGGIATSGVLRRRWRLGGREVHHVVDPGSGHPVEAVWRTVTAAASSCVDANAASTAALVKGGGAVAWLEWLGMPARLVAADGSVVRVAGWPDDGEGTLG